MLVCAARGSNNMTAGASSSEHRERRGQEEKATRFLLYSATCLFFCLGTAVSARAQNTRSNETTDFWTATTQTSFANTSPSRMTESHDKSGNQSIDKLNVEVLGPNGRYEPDYEIEKETVQVDATTTRTVERTYTWDANGQRNLVQVAEEEARNSANGDARVVRTISRSDGNGGLQVVERKVSDTRRTSPNVQETKTTLYLRDINDVLTPITQIQDLETRRDDHTVEVETTMFRQVSSGGAWQVGETRERTIREDDTTRTSDEQLSQADLDGNLHQVSRTVAKQTNNAAGEQGNTVDTYSVDVPGFTRDTTLHLIRRVITVQKSTSGEETTEQLIEEPNPSNPNSGLRVTSQASDVTYFGPFGTQQTKTVQVRDINGTFSVIAVQMRETTPQQ